MNTLVSVTETIKSVGETLYISPAVLVGDIYEISMLRRLRNTR